MMDQNSTNWEEGRNVYRSITCHRGRIEEEEEAAAALLLLPFYTTQ